VEIELKRMMKRRKLLIPLKGKNAKKHWIRPSEVHAGYTSSQVPVRPFR
jgi:hypothetical protein